MTDETEGRLADIQASVHRIESSVQNLKERQDRTDLRMTEVERDVIEVRAEQRGMEKVQSVENRMLHDKIDAIAVGQTKIDRRLVDHLEQEEEDRKAQIEVQRETNANLRSAIWKIVLSVMGGFATVIWFLIQQQMTK